MLCNKCRQAPPREGDTWCIPCSAWESVAVGLGGKWVAGGLREAAAEAVVGTARLVRSLRNLDAGLVAQSKASAAKPRELKEGPVDIKKERSRSPLARARSASAVAAPPAADEDSEYTYVDEESEEEEEASRPVKVGKTAEGSRGSERPPEPREPPRVKSEDKTEERRHKSKKEHPSKDSGRRSRKEQTEDKGPAGSGRRRRRKRGGRKHKRLHRVVTDPHVRVHRSLGQEFWDQDLSRRDHWAPRHE